MLLLRVPINSERDTEIARNALRKKLVEQRCWSPAFYARTIAVLVALAETILNIDANGVINVLQVEDGEDQGVEMDCRLAWLGGRSNTLADARHRQFNDLQLQLARITEDVMIEEAAAAPHLIVRVWPTKGDCE